MGNSRWFWAVGVVCVACGSESGPSNEPASATPLNSIDTKTTEATYIDGGTGPATNRPLPRLRRGPKKNQQSPDAGAGGAGGAVTDPSAGGATASTGGVSSGTGGTTDPGTVGGVQRPAGNTGKGFFVRDSKIYDANGAEFRIRGLNHTHWWGTNNEAAIPHIANTGANAVRVVFGSGMGASTPSARRAVVESYLAENIVPVVDQHDGTCQTDVGYLNNIVNFWTNPEEKAWLVDHEREVILNVANEWGPSNEVWRDAYINAIGQLRAAGINNMLVIDAGECGQSADVVLAHAKAVFDSDPQKNVAFSVHMYSYWVDAGNPVAGTWSATAPYDMDKTLSAMHDLGLAWVVGEFSWEAASSLVWYHTKAAMSLYEKYGIGWLAWSWNQNSEPLLDIVHDYTYDSESDLTDFGNLLVHDADVGLKALAEPATIF
jgi:mannan endo-1,4-beta-mannosidase